jgi:signal peptidase II
MSRDRRLWLFFIAACVVALDRLTKAWIVAHIQIGDTIRVIPRVFWLSHVQNPGAAFSLFVDSARPTLTHWLLVGFSLAAALVVFLVLLRLGRRFTPTTVALALVLGGTIGNVWDRIRFGMVTDFLAVRIYHYHWPDFNVADSSIVIGGILLVLDALRAPHHETARTKEPQ